MNPFNETATPPSGEEDYDVRFSIGTNPALDKVRGLINDPTLLFDTFLINLGTLIRNRHTKDMSALALEKQTLQELDDLVSELVLAIVHSKRVVRPVILFYVADYDMYLPPSMRRPIPPSRATEAAVYHQFLKMMKNPSSVIRDEVAVIQESFKGLISPVRSLNMEIAKYSNLKHVLLWSHYPIDFHICHTYKNMRLVESFTGRVMEPKEFGKKIFKQEHLPFTPELHTLLGDSTLIKPALGIKEKRRLLEIAEKEVWDFKTPTQINNRLKHHGFKPAFKMI